MCGTNGKDAVGTNEHSEDTKEQQQQYECEWDRKQLRCD